MNLDKHISNLLFHHNCVVIPEFGAFVARRVNSVYKLETSVFSPPSKKLMFNPLLVQNDGLLVQEVARVERLNFDKAKEEIDSVVRFWKDHLANNQKLNISSLGMFTKNADGSLNFEPYQQNFLLESFGLENIQAKQILMAQQKDGSSTVWWKTAAMLPILIGGFLYFGQPQPVTNFVNQQWSGFVSPIMNPNQEALKAVESPIKTIKEDVFIYSAEKKNTEDVVYNYQVIAGAFKKIDEAHTMVERLQQQGFDKARFTQKKGSFNFVALMTFETKEDALGYAKSKSGEIPNLWVLSLKD